MEKLETLQARHATELAKLNAGHALALLCPVPPHRVQINKGLGDWLIYEAANLWEAIALMRQFPVLSFNHYKGTFSRFVPADLDHDGAVAGENYCVKLDVSQGEGFRPSVELRFFTKLGDNICEAHCSIKAGHIYSAAFQAAPSGRDECRFDNRMIRGEWRPNSTLGDYADETTKWASGDGRSAHYQYSIHADGLNDDGFVDWTDAGYRLENIAGEMHGPQKGGVS